MAKKKETKAATKEVEKVVVPAKPTDLETDKMIGPVKEIMMSTYKAHQKGGTIFQGKMELGYSFHSNNFIKSYHENGYRSKMETFGTDGHKIHKYDERGREYENFELKDNVVARTTTMTYDEKGNMIAALALNADGSLYYRTSATFTKDNKPLENFHWMKEPEVIISHVIYEYDEKGNYTACLQYKTDDVLSHKTVMTYNDQGKLIESKGEWFEENMMPFNSRTTHKLNDHGDSIETNVYDQHDKLKDTYHQTYEYDSDGKRIIPFREPYDPDPLAKGETEEFENDSHGNWIKKTRLYNKMPVTISLREISYYDNDSANKPSFIHPFLTIPKEEVVEKKEPKSEEEKMPIEHAKFLVDGPQATPENFQHLRYYAIKYREAPSVINFQGPYIEPFALYNELEENMRAEEIYSFSTVYNGHRERIARYTMSFPGYPGYLLNATGIGGQNKYDFEVPKSITKHTDDYVYTSQIQLLRPSIASGLRDDYFEREITEYIEYCTYTRKPDQPTINMIEVTNQGFVMESHDVDDSFEIKDLDVNYGYGFTQFHKELMGRFNNSKKGLVLFHGLPGTGKTYYIRHLLREMANSNKEVIYMPPNMVDHLTEPVFMTFLSGEVRQWSSQGKFCVLLIEDAEPLLAKRQEGVRIQGVTNLLNMTDGLLNDMLNLQIICTFNVDLKKLDSALLRPGRLIARKEFKALNELDANLLAQRLGIKHHFKKPATLGEIYSFGKDMSTLIHDVEADRDASTNIDDL